MRREMEAFQKMPDTAGTGKYPALKEEVASLPDHVVYRPADLTKLGKEKLGGSRSAMVVAVPTVRGRDFILPRLHHTAISL